MFDLRNRRVCHNELYDIYFSRKQRAKCGPTADRLSCRISTKMGLKALWWHYTQQATTVRVFTATGSYESDCVLTTAVNW